MYIFPLLALLIFFVAYGYITIKYVQELFLKILFGFIIVGCIFLNLRLILLLI